MKIALDARLLDKRHNTGISRYTEFLMEYYVKRYGEENLCIITNDIELQIEKWNIIPTKLKPFNIFHFCRYGHFIKQFHFDILHIPFYSGTLFELRGTFVLLTVHDLMYRLVKDFFGGNLILSKAKKIYFDFIVKHSVRNANAVISVSKTTSADLLEAFNIKSVVIPENSEICTEREMEIIEKYNLHPKGFFLYCGNNRPHKNLKLVIEVFNSSLELPTLVLAGKGHQSSSNVIAVDVVSDAELKALYESAIAFVFPSKYEGFGLPILESLEFGTPVIASRISAFIEFQNKNIFYFDVDDSKQLKEALNEVLNHKFIDDMTFFEKYRKDSIYKMLDALCRI
jgi:glycosyltransferase involved in cell wall biosynthesis